MRTPEGNADDGDNTNFAPSFLMASTAGNIAYKREDGGWTRCPRPGMDSLK